MQAEIAPIDTLDTRHVYRASLQSPSYRRYRRSNMLVAISNGVVFFVFQVPQVLLSQREWLDAIFTTLIYTCLILAVYGAMSRFRPQLVVTPEAFEYTGPRQRFWIYWSDVEAIGRLPPRGVEGLCLPRTRYGHLGSWEFGWRRSFVPLDWFADDWRNSPLGDDIRRYAPWLLDGSRGFS